MNYKLKQITDDTFVLTRDGELTQYALKKEKNHYTAFQNGWIATRFIYDDSLKQWVMMGFIFVSIALERLEALTTMLSFVNKEEEVEA